MLKKYHLNTLFRFLPWICLVMWIVLQIPFLTADPDSLVDLNTRGAWTDEGLYSGTARNFLNTGTIDPYENSLYTRGPLFTWLQIPVFFLFGQSLVTARLMVLVLVVLSLILMLRHKDTRMAGLFLLGAGFTQFHLFQFSHYAMAEMMGTAIILLAILCILKTENNPSDRRYQLRWILLASGLLFVVYALKIQFLYIAFLLPGYYLIRLLPVLFFKNGEGPWRRRQFFLSLLVTGAWMVLYGAAWYLPNREFYDYVMAREVDGRFPALESILNSARFNFTVLLWVPYLKPLIVAGAVALAGGLVRLLWKPRSWSAVHKTLFLLGLVWFLGELHKIPMTYMPHRYLVSAYAAVALMIASFAASIAAERKWQTWIMVVLVLCLAAAQLSHTSEAIGRRTYDLRAVNRYLRQYPWEGKTITGAWGPSAAWGTKARVFPVWYGFVNDDRAMDARMVIAESDQEDSDRSLLMQGIDIRTASDSSRRFPIWRYQVDFYWIPEK